MLAFYASVLTFLMTMPFTEGSLHQYATFKKCFKGNTLVTLYNLSFNKCIAECQLRPQCVAANYWRQRKKCELVESNGTAPLQRVLVDDSCVSIAISDLPEVERCTDCENGTDCKTNENQCERKECQPLSAKTGTMKGNMQTVGAKKKVICDKSFKLEPANARPVCRANRTWSVLPECISDKTCGAPPNVTYAMVQSKHGDGEPGTVLTYSCNDGYGSPPNMNHYTVECRDDEQWTDVDFECKINCSDPSAIHVEHADLEDGDTLEGAVRKYTCRANYTTVTGSGFISLKCTVTGQWTETYETCLRDCFEPIQIANAILDVGQTYEGSVRKYTCIENYITVTGSTDIFINCTSIGEWTQPTEPCLMGCPEPSKIEHATLDKWGIVDEAVRTYTCWAGYITSTGSNSITVTCTSTGQWSTPSDTCLRTCETLVALITGPHGIDNRFISASSSYPKWGPQYGRLNDPKAWIAADPMQEDEYIQFKFQHSKIVERIITQGSPYDSQDETEWVTSYKIHYSVDCTIFTLYEQIFNGNIDHNSRVSNEIKPAIEARCVRVYPQTWRDHIAMRVELMGCQP